MSTIGSTNVIKMVVLPKCLFLCQSLNRCTVAGDDDVKFWKKKSDVVGVKVLHQSKLCILGTSMHL